MLEKAIQIHNVSKRYKLGQRGTSYATLRDQLAHLFIPKTKEEIPKDEYIWALKDVSFDVYPGEVVGVIGRNGSGKSTLLKILSRITAPTGGEVDLVGRVSSLLEVGTGFHPELTGRENIFLNGAVLGMRRREIMKKFDEIVEFSEVKKFIDTPVKFYSSGMYVRLAFSVASHLEPQILLVDEVLAVGDGSFRNKCMAKMESEAKSGRTIFFVSHDISSVLALCNKTCFLDRGIMKDYGNTKDVVAKYIASGSSEAGSRVWDGGLSEMNVHNFSVNALRVIGENGVVSSSVDVQRPFSIEIDFELKETMDVCRVGLEVVTTDGQYVFESYDTDVLSNGTQRFPGVYTSTCYFPGNFFNINRYYIFINACIDPQHPLAYEQYAMSFDVEDTGVVGKQLNPIRKGLVRPALQWEVNKKF